MGSPPFVKHERFGLFTGREKWLNRHIFQLLVHGSFSPEFKLAKLSSVCYPLFRRSNNKRRETSCAASAAM
jgi:hypothetical protein